MTVTDSLAFILIVAGTWLAIGVVLSTVMGRRGHNGFGWFVTGSLLGPLGLVLAFDEVRHAETMAASPAGGGTHTATGSGPVDVVVGYDGSPESVAAMDAVVDLLGGRLGRLTLTSVVPYGEVREQDREAAESLRQVADRSTLPVFELELLHGRPPDALVRFAIEGGYGMIAAGTRGKGITKAVLGSTASELARHSKVPVLLVGAR